MRALPPIAKLSERLHLDIEQAVRQFARVDRHLLGADLRRQAADVRRLVDRAWRDRANQRQWTQELQWAIDELRITLQLGKDLHAFRSFAQFEALIRLAEDLGRQVGGWLRAQQQQPHLTGQSPARVARPERAQTLSTRAASHGANR
jgi:hypothetical protein